MDVTNVSDPLSFLNASQQKVLAITPKVSSSLSIAGSIFIIVKMWKRDRSNKLEGIYTRLLLCLTVADLTYSVACFLSTWPVPKGNVHSNYIWGEAGNQTTCNIQGFMLQSAGMASAFYTSSLSFSFLVFVRYKWNAEKFKKIEPFIHFVSSAVPVVLAIVCWLKDLYNPTVTGCYIQSYPIKCEKSDTVECIRGGNVTRYRLFMLYLPIWLGLIFITVSMVMLYWSVRQRESSYANRWGYQTKKKSRQVFVRACKYVGAFFVAYMPLFVTSIMIQQGKESFTFRFLRVLLSPLQGFFNAIVYSKDGKKDLVNRRRSTLFGAFSQLTVSGTTHASVFRRSTALRRTCAESCRCVAQEVKETDSETNELEVVRDSALEFPEIENIQSCGTNELQICNSEFSLDVTDGGQDRVVLTCNHEEVDRAVGTNCAEPDDSNDT